MQHKAQHHSVLWFDCLTADSFLFLNVLNSHRNVSLDDCHVQHQMACHPTLKVMKLKLVQLRCRSAPAASPLSTRGWEWLRCHGRLWSYRRVLDFTSSASSSRIQSIVSWGRGRRYAKETVDDDAVCTVLELSEVQGQDVLAKYQLMHANLTLVNIWNDYFNLFQILSQSKFKGVVGYGHGFRLLWKVISWFFFPPTICQKLCKCFRHWSIGVWVHWNINIFHFSRLNF